ncbi:hypothetical protein Cni_G00685 [Canna indica]|uniref:Dilute domain-containing protein n=1 Tax=Canna indica TaxID=4628 RepID=A0AAQ3JN78_9LILI|nr:hypothetical protein Cni_G00685 [Canna indica]
MGAMEKAIKHPKEGKSDNETIRNSITSQGDTPNVDDDKIKKTLRVPKRLLKKEPADNRPRSSQGSATNQEHGRLQFKASGANQKKFQMPGSGRESPKSANNKRFQNIYVPSRPASEVSVETGNRIIQQVKETDILGEVPFCDQNNGTDDELVDTEINTLDGDRENVYQKIDEMELRIDKLEEELREVAALEISLYSVVAEHGSSANKVHAPARRLSRLYIHACKYWTQDKKATVSRNTVSGLVLVAKSCGNDISRLTFWLSNIVVLRETVSQTLCNFSNYNATLRTVVSNGGTRKPDGKLTSMKLERNSGYNREKQIGFVRKIDEWQDTSAFTGALEKIESWIFTRIVESVWWQTLTPHMQSVVEDLNTPKSYAKLLGPALGNQQQGSFSVNLWKSAFRDAFSRLCPVRAGGQECGCLDVLARKVMKQCISRLDVALFNAILRKSAHEIPTDPLSDPIIDPKVLPIPAGHLSFGSGAQLKSSIGNLSRWLTELLGMDAEESVKHKQGTDEHIDRSGGDIECENFHLLNELSDVLMLPKDMLLDRATRKEVCPSIGMPNIMRILCNFTPDEFCSDPVPGIVLEQLHTESNLERRLPEEELKDSVAYPAPPVVYSPTYVANIIGENGEMLQRKGYKSDEDLEELDAPFVSIIDKSLSKRGSSRGNARYKLLREILIPPHHATDPCM